MHRSVYISSYVNCIEVYPGFTLAKEDVVKRGGLFARKLKVNLDL